MVASVATGKEGVKPRVLYVLGRGGEKPGFRSNYPDRTTVLFHVTFGYNVSDASVQRFREPLRGIQGRCGARFGNRASPAIRGQVTVPADQVAKLNEALEKVSKKLKTRL